MPVPPSQSDIDMARKLNYALTHLGLPLLLPELVVLAFFDRSGNSILYTITRFLASLPEMSVMTYFTFHIFGSRILKYLKQWVLLWILVWRYPALGMEGVLELCKRDAWDPEMAPDDTEKEMLGEVTRAAKEVVSPSSFKCWAFIINGAIYCREPDSPIVSGAFQQFLFPLKLMACAALYFAIIEFLVSLPLEYFNFDRHFEEDIENAANMQEIRAENALVDVGGDKHRD
ncbi:hypothetical protein C8J56DRAFT_1156689 [Mycena floridula]|nr:hypothetical protein C8J56DRAFT_1156689 [Mycena floridula]